MIKELDNIKLTAIQFIGDNFNEVKDFVGNYYSTYSYYAPPIMGFSEISEEHIAIVEKGIPFNYKELNDGDWVIKIHNTVTGKDPIFIIISEYIVSGGYSNDSNS